MKTLDKSRPFGEIYGKHRAKYVQDGVEFDSKGRMMGGAGPKPKKEKEVNPLDNLSITDLRQLVAEKGGEYTNRVDAIKFLKEKDDVS